MEVQTWSVYNHKIAYMISAYVEPASLESLVRALNDIDVDFFIHIDKKVEIFPFKILLEEYPNVYFLPEEKRVYISWGGYSQLQMQYNMIQALLESGYRYRRVVNLTGTDYPVMSNKELKAKLIGDSEEYIVGFCLGDEISIGNGRYKSNRDKILYWHMMDSNRIIKSFFDIFRVRRYKNYDEIGYNFYFGSEYWALSYEVLGKLIEKFDKDLKLKRILRYTFAPSEMWVHTLFFNSSYRENGSVYGNVYNGLYALSPLEYFEYGNQIKILTEDDYEKILQSGKMFARKLYMEESRTLRYMLDRYREL